MEAASISVGFFDTFVYGRWIAMTSLRRNVKSLMLQTWCCNQRSLTIWCKIIRFGGMIERWIFESGGRHMRAGG